MAMSDSDAGRAAYARFRLNNTRASADVTKQITQVEEQIARLQATLARQRAASVLREQGMLYAWMRVRADAHHELAALAEKPWFESLTCETAGTDQLSSAAPLDLPPWLLQPAVPPEGQGLHLTARLQGSGSLRLWIRPAAWPMVQIQSPPIPDGPGALFDAMLAGLAAEGRLAEVVVVCAQRLGLTLADRGNGGPHQVDGHADHHYFLQRAAWLMADGAPGDPQQTDWDAAARQLGDLQRRLFILDEQRRQLRARDHDRELVSRYEQEYDALRSRPHVASLVVRGEQVELTTDVIRIQGVTVGRFSVHFGFSSGTIDITNQTGAQYDDETRYDHPHVRNGSPCLGNISRPIADFLANRDLPRLVDLTLDFLESYNADNPFRPLGMWG
jgi:hypothetical protein